MSIPWKLHNGMPRDMEGILQLLQNHTAGRLASVYGMTPKSSGSLLGGLGLNLFNSRSVSQLKAQGLPAAHFKDLDALNPKC